MEHRICNSTEQKILNLQQQKVLNYQNLINKIMVLKPTLD